MSDAKKMPVTLLPLLLAMGCAEGCDGLGNSQPGGPPLSKSTLASDAGVADGDGVDGDAPRIVGANGRADTPSAAGGQPLSDTSSEPEGGSSASAAWGEMRASLEGAMSSEERPECSASKLTMKPAERRGNTVRFAANPLSNLRSCAGKLGDRPIVEGSEWFLIPYDPTRVLLAFPALAMQEDYVLRGYFQQGMDAIGVLFGFPAGRSFPKPDVVPSLRTHTKLYDSVVPYPDGAIEEVGRVLEGDDSAASYLQASLFIREAYEFGALWHSSHWAGYRVLDHLPTSASGSWRWEQARPSTWQPTVELGVRHVRVVFFALNRRGVETVHRFEDVYPRNHYHPTSTKKLIATGGLGPIP